VTRVAPSLEHVPYSRIREIAELAMSLDGVLALYFGESNIPTPRFVIDAAEQALADGHTFYSPNAGLPSLRRAIASQYQRLHGVELDPTSEIVVTASGVQALNLVLRYAVDPGDEAIILSPAWPNGSSIVRLSHGTPVEVPLVLAGDRYRIDFDVLEDAIGPRTRAILLTSPSNPLGWMATEEEQQRLLDLCREHGLWLVADEVYERIFYSGARGEAAPSLLRLCTRDDPVIVVQSFSKTYCMTGWRVGWLVGPRAVGEKLAQLNEFVVSHAPTFLQVAAETAIEQGEPWVARMVESFRENRDYCAEAVAAMPGVSLPRPEGAFYLFPRIEGLVDSFDLCRRLLLEERVGVAPGSAFGAGGEGSIRLCYAADRSVLEPALERLGRFLGAGVRKGRSGNRAG
jgi:aspartate/methionine/tyrosine aminotransferase